MISVLRDTGCSGVMVKDEFVKSHQYTGRTGSVMMVDKTRRTVPTARINVKTAYYSGVVEALCLPDAIYDLDHWEYRRR